MNNFAKSLIISVSLIFVLPVYADECWNGTIWTIAGRNYLSHFERVQAIRVSELKELEDLDDVSQYLLKLKNYIPKIQNGLKEYKPGCYYFDDQLYKGEEFNGATLPSGYKDLPEAIDAFAILISEKYDELQNRYNSSTLKKSVNNSGIQIQPKPIDIESFKSLFESTSRSLGRINKKTHALNAREDFASHVNNLNELLDSFGDQLKVVTNPNGRKQERAVRVREMIQETLTWYQGERGDNLNAICTSKNHFEKFPSVCTTKVNFEKLYLDWSSKVSGKNITEIYTIDKLIDIAEGSYVIAKEQLQEEERKERERIAQEQEAVYRVILTASEKLDKRPIFRGYIKAADFAEALVKRLVNENDIGKIIFIKRSDQTYYVTQIIEGGALLERTNSYYPDLPVILESDTPMFVGDYISDIGSIYEYKGLRKYTTVLGASRQAVALKRLE